MLSYWGGVAAIVIMMLVCLVILFVCWEELKGVYFMIDCIELIKETPNKVEK